jgi:hypothetical protein
MKKTMLKPHVGKLQGPQGNLPSQTGSKNADKPNDATDQRNRRDDDEDDPDKNPKHQYQEPMRHVITIVGGKVSVESKREQKLLARACLNVAKVDDLIADPRLTPGHIAKSTSAGQINGPPSPN